MKWAAQTFTRSVRVTADVTETITMPATGEVLINYEAIEGQGFHLELRVAGAARGDSPNWGFDAALPGSPRTFLAGPVLPGDYLAVLESGPMLYGGKMMAPPLPVTVKPGATTSITFQKP